MIKSHIEYSYKCGCGFCVSNDIFWEGGGYDRKTTIPKTIS